MLHAQVRDLVSGREWWYETTAVLAVSKEEVRSERAGRAVLPVFEKSLREE